MPIARESHFKWDQDGIRLESSPPRSFVKSSKGCLFGLLIRLRCNQRVIQNKQYIPAKIIQDEKA